MQLQGTDCIVFSGVTFSFSFSYSFRCLLLGFLCVFFVVVVVVVVAFVVSFLFFIVFLFCFVVVVVVCLFIIVAVVVWGCFSCFVFICSFVCFPFFFSFLLFFFFFFSRSREKFLYCKEPKCDQIPREKNRKYVLIPVNYTTENMSYVYFVILLCTPVLLFRKENPPLINSNSPEEVNWRWLNAASKPGLYYIQNARVILYPNC